MKRLVGRRFQPGEGPSRGLFRDCENFADGSFAAVQWSSLHHAANKQEISRLEPRLAGLAAWAGEGQTELIVMHTPPSTTLQQPGCGHQYFLVKLMCTEHVGYSVDTEHVRYSVDTAARN